MSKYSYIFDDVISTATTKEKVKLIIPILVGWAKAGISKKTYSDLNKLIGYESGLNSTVKAVFSQTCYGRWNIDGRERITAEKARSSQTCHAIHHTFISNTL